MPHIVSACVTLHNKCEMYGDSCCSEWIHHTSSDINAPSFDTSGADIGASGADIRDAIMQYISSTS